MERRDLTLRSGGLANYGERAGEWCAIAPTPLNLRLAALVAQMIDREEVLTFTARMVPQRRIKTC
jgi:hypothetical protein